jgi:hypothetical protein
LLAAVDERDPAAGNSHVTVSAVAFAPHGLQLRPVARIPANHLIYAQALENSLLL